MTTRTLCPKHGAGSVKAPAPASRTPWLLAADPASSGLSRRAWAAIGSAALLLLQLTGCASMHTAKPEVARMTTPMAPVVRRIELANTFVHELVAAKTGRKYTVWVALPPRYEQIDKPLPVLFATDAPYAVPLLRNISNLVGAGGRNIEPFILVGLGYQEGGGSRNRDYTPTNPLLDPAANRRTYEGASYGEAARYRDLIEQQVFPLIAQHYRADMERTIYFGQSYGGLFGAYVLLTKPELFKTYLLGSPSLWFDKQVIWSLEADYARQHRDLNAKVLMYTGSFETVKTQARYIQNPEFDLLGQMYAFEAQLKSRAYPGLRITALTLNDEDHRTMGPGFMTRALLWALPGTGPYNPE